MKTHPLTIIYTLILLLIRGNIFQEHGNRGDVNIFPQNCSFNLNSIDTHFLHSEFKGGFQLNWHWHENEF